MPAASGDFHQLPPVAKGKEAAAARKFAFQAATWRQCIHHCSQLTKVFRQVDPCAYFSHAGSSSSSSMSHYFPELVHCLTMLPMQLHTVLHKSMNSMDACKKEAQQSPAS